MGSRFPQLSEQLPAATARDGTLPSLADLRTCQIKLSQVDVTSREGGVQLSQLCVAVVSWLSAFARCPLPSSAASGSLYIDMLKLLEDLCQKLQKLLPSHIRTTAWAEALLCSDILQCLSRALDTGTQAVLGGLQQRSAGSDDACAGGVGIRRLLHTGALRLQVIAALKLLDTIAAAAYADSAVVQDAAAPCPSGPQPLHVQLVEAVRDSRVLEHLARGMAVLAMRRGADMAAQEQGGRGAGGGAGGGTIVQQLPLTAGTLSWSMYSGAFLNITGIFVPPAGSRFQPYHKWPPPAAHVDLAVCGPWSQHLLLAWGLHHLHALDGGGHCGLHPDVVRGLPPAWEPPAQGAAGGPQGGGSTGRAGAAGAAASSGISSGGNRSGGSRGLRELQPHALWRFTELLSLYAQRVSFPAGCSEVRQGVAGAPVARASGGGAKAAVRRGRDAGEEAAQLESREEPPTPAAGLAPPNVEQHLGPARPGPGPSARSGSCTRERERVFTSPRKLAACPGRCAGRWCGCWLPGWCGRRWRQRRRGSGTIRVEARRDRGREGLRLQT